MVKYFLINQNNYLSLITVDKNINTTSLYIWLCFLILKKIYLFCVF